MATKKETSVDILEITRGRIEFLILGTTPLIYNAMSAKVKQDLLLPPQKKNAAEKASSLKHNPLEEYRGTMYYARDQKGPTTLMMPSVNFKAALRSAALDMPGTNKSQIGRLSYVEGTEVSIYGVPQLLMSVTRSADINKTPDVRSRAILPEWACKITVQYTTPIIKQQAIVNLMAAAGITNGVGDWRVQKGSGNFGQFVLVDATDAQFKSIIKNGGKKAQDAAIKNPEFYDVETEELHRWWESETKRRGFKVV